MLAIAALLALAPQATAAGLRVNPVLLEIQAPAMAGAFTMRNESASRISVQTRVYRWSQAGGKETLEPAVDVVASPPIVNLEPGSDHIVRCVRLNKQPVQREESYRVVVDQLPTGGAAADRAVTFLVRQSIPVFFRSATLAPPNVTWALKADGGAAALHAENAGDERLRIAALRLQDKSGKEISLGPGLVGYVLGRSTMSWPLPDLPAGFGADGGVSLIADSNKGLVRAVAATKLAR